MIVYKNWLFMSIFMCIVCNPVPYGNHGCKGGNMLYAFKYVIANEGLDVTKAYPFQGKVTQNIIATKSELS